VGADGVSGADGLAVIRERAMIFGKRVAILTLVLLVLSPYFVMSSATLLAHSTAALFLMTFLYFILRAQAPAANLLWWPMAGLALGWAGLTRPLAAAAFALPFVSGWPFASGVSTPGKKFWGTALFAVAGLAGLGVFCAYNVALTGRPFTTGYHTYSTLYGTRSISARSRLRAASQYL